MRYAIIAIAGCLVEMQKTVEELNTREYKDKDGNPIVFVAHESVEEALKDKADVTLTRSEAYELPYIVPVQYHRDSQLPPEEVKFRKKQDKYRQRFHSRNKNK